jgi:hypothetical protein
LAEKEQKKEAASTAGGGIPGLKPPNPDDLPREYLSPEELAERDKKEGLYGDFTEQKQAVVKDKVEAKKQDIEGLEWLTRISAQAGRDMAFYAGMESFEFEMDDGSIEKYDRVSPVEYEWNELEDLRAEIEGKEAMDDGHKLSRREVRLKEKLMEQLIPKYYLIHAKTRQPMMPEVSAHVKNSNRFRCIQDALVLVSLHKAVVGKK